MITVNITTTAKVGFTIGISILKRMVSEFAPSSFADSSKLMGNCSKADFIMII